MSKFFKPDIKEPKPVEERSLKEVQARGRTGRTILAGSKQQNTITQRKSILGG